FWRFATQNLSAVVQSAPRPAQTARHRSNVACALVKHDASPPPQMLSPCAIKRQALRSFFTLVAHVFRQLCFVVGSLVKQVASLVAHLVAHLTPTPGAKPLS